MKALFFIVVLVLIGVVVSDAQTTNQIASGMQRSDVILRMGRPKGSVSRGSKEVLLFEKGTVTLRKGKVVMFDLLSSLQYEQKRKLENEKRRRLDEAKRISNTTRRNVDLNSYLLMQLSAMEMNIAPKQGVAPPSRNTVGRDFVASDYCTPIYSYLQTVAENGDIRGADNDGDGRVEPVHVKGYTRKDGTYVRGHYRASPRR